MAHMYPETLEGLTIQSRAEEKLYSVISQSVSDHFHVFHSVAWLGIRHPGSPPVDGEADFIVIHEKMGILVIEVKGGIVGFDEKSGWYSIRRDGRSVSIQDPFAQARRSKYALKDKIESLPNWQGPIPTIGHAVAFPDSVIEVEEIGPDSPGEIIFQHEHLEDPEVWLRSCLKFWAGDHFIRPGRNGVETLRRILRKSRLFREPRLGEMIGPEEKAIHYYTKDQFRLLDYIQGRRQAAIRGCAGSGKTVLALEKSRRLANEGFRTLLTCYNKNLAHELRKSAGKAPRLKVQNFHALAREYAALTGRDQKQDWDDSAGNFFSEIMPDALAEAASTGEKKFFFDAIVVDEGQDFDETWWVALKMLLADPESGVLYVFFDDNQLVYHRDFKLPIEEAPFLLSVNCRNTRHIHDAISEFYQSDIPISCEGPPGRPVELHEYGASAADLRAMLTELLTLLVFNEKVDSGDIVILSPGGPGKEPFSSMENPGVFTLSSIASGAKNEIWCTSIRLFKGLESRIVILVVPDLTHENEMMYVGISRARNHLYILHSEDVTKYLIEKLGSDGATEH